MPDLTVAVVLCLTFFVVPAVVLAGYFVYAVRRAPLVDANERPVQTSDERTYGAERRAT